MEERLGMRLFVDGGGTPTVPTYFSYKCLDDSKIEMNRFYLTNLCSDLLPDNCSIYDHRRLSTNNIAEYAACWYGLSRFKEYYDGRQVTIFQDSQLVVNQVKGEWDCKQEHLQPWLKAIRNIWWDKVEIQWVPRQEVVAILGH